jgi:hypothetical protein
MKRAVVTLAVSSTFVACVLAFAACSNDFGALVQDDSAAANKDAGKSSGGGSSSGDPGDDDDTGPTGTSSGAPIEGKDASSPGDCSKPCEPAKVTANGTETITSDGCCTFESSCSDAFQPRNCSTKCTNGAICTGSCEEKQNCDYEVATGSKGDFTCSAGFCKLECRAGANCTLDCDSEDCLVNCAPGAHCVVEGCAFSNCDLNCGDGDEPEVCEGTGGGGSGPTKACGGCPE